jgi:hypothetical protein
MKIVMNKRRIEYLCCRLYFPEHLSLQHEGSHVIGMSLYLNTLGIEGRGLDSSGSV